MLYAIIDPFNTKVDSMKELGNKYKLREDFDNSESFSQDLIKQINNRLSGDPPEKSKAFIMLNALVSNISVRDFVLLSAVGKKTGSGGISSVSVPEINIDDHLLMWSEVYGMLLLSAEKFNGHKDDADPQNIDGDHFILFDCLPPFVIGVSVKGDKMSIISEIKNTEINDKKAELVGDFAAIAFKEWTEYANKNEGVEKIFEFSFLMQNEYIEC